MRETGGWKVSIHQIREDGTVQESKWHFGVLPNIGDRIDLEQNDHRWVVTGFEWFNQGRHHDPDPSVRILTTLDPNAVRTQEGVIEVDLETDRIVTPFEADRSGEPRSDARLRDRVQKLRSALDMSGQYPIIVNWLDKVLGGGPIAFTTAGDAIPPLGEVELDAELVERFDRLARMANSDRVPHSRRSLMEQALVPFITAMEGLVGDEASPT